MSRAEWLVVPALNPEPNDLIHVLAAGRAAGLNTCVVLQGGDPSSMFVAADADALITSSVPLGKGGAVKAAWARLGHVPTVVCDADLYDITPTTLLTLALMAREGLWGRGRHDATGRVGKRVTALLRAFDMPAPRVDPSTYLSGLQAYPANLAHLVDLDTVPDGYGFDLALFIDLWRAAPTNFRTHYAGPRHHRPGDAAHIQHLLHEVLDAVLSRSRTWSE